MLRQLGYDLARALDTWFATILERSFMSQVSELKSRLVNKEIRLCESAL